MGRLFVMLCTLCFGAAVARSARGEEPVQAGAHAGLECWNGCTESGFAVGLTGFWNPGRVGSLGVLLEYVHTSGERRTATKRAGVALRAYMSRDGLLEPYVQLALGPAWYRRPAGACSVQAFAFLQVAAGLEARVIEHVHAGGALAATQHAYAMDCGEEAGSWGDTGPTYGFLLSLRVE